jgi:surfeit locus 1 family protein
MTACVMALLPLVISLGFWQLHRAEQKQDYQQVFMERTSAQATVPPVDLHDVAFKRVRLIGRFEPRRYFLVDNQIHAGQPGYWVVASFLAADGRRWLVNRGWIVAPRTRDVLPEVPIPLGSVEAIGAFWPDTGLVPLLAPNDWGSAWPKRVQRLNVARMAGLLENAAPQEIRLEPGQPGMLTELSTRTGFDGNRHRGYAAQWFGLAVVLLVGYGVFGFRR